MIIKGFEKRFPHVCFGHLSNAKSTFSKVKNGVSEHCGIKAQIGLGGVKSPKRGAPGLVKQRGSSGRNGGSDGLTLIHI